MGERYADLALGKRNWQIAVGGLLAVSLVLPGGTVRLSTRSRFVSYIVEVDKLGYALTVPQPLTSTSVPNVTTGIERYDLAAFIRDARAVSSDPPTKRMHDRLPREPRDH